MSTILRQRFKSVICFYTKDLLMNVLLSLTQQYFTIHSSITLDKLHQLTGNSHSHSLYLHYSLIPVNRKR